MSGTLLLADDSITIQKVVELTFAETEHKVFAVGSGRDLLQRLPEIKPDVVLCDVVMPDMNGYDVCRMLKSDPNTLHIPVVLLTGTFEPFDRDRAQAVGCDAIVTKPFEARELIGVVEELLQRIPAPEPAPAPTEYGPLGEQGIPEGVPALEFTTSGFDRMVAEPVPEPALPEDGIELTASALGDSHPAQLAPAPPELAEPDLSSAVAGEAFAFGDEMPSGAAPASPFGALAPAARPEPAVPVFAPEAPAPPVAGEPFFVEGPRADQADDLFALDSAPAPAAEFAPEPATEPEPEIEHVPAFAHELEAAPPFAMPPAEPAHTPGLVGTVAAVAAPIAAAALSHEMVERIARRAAELIPPPPAAPAPTAAELLTDEHVERIARRAAELVPAPPAPPTAAELLTDEHVERVARRAAELVPAPPAPPTAAELLTDEHVERVARRAAELVPLPPAPPTAAELLTDEHVERIARRAAAFMPVPPAPPTAAELLTDEHVERVARRAAELVPPPPATPATAGALSDEEIEKIARRMVELAAPQLERIAWEVIPDMAEMLVRKRIVELEKAAEEGS